MVIGDHRNRREIRFRVDSGIDRRAPAGRAAGRREGRGLAWKALDDKHAFKHPAQVLNHIFGYNRRHIMHTDEFDDCASFISRTLRTNYGHGDQCRLEDCILKFPVAIGQWGQLYEMRQAKDGLVPVFDTVNTYRWAKCEYRVVSGTRALNKRNRSPPRTKERARSKSPPRKRERVKPAVNQAANQAAAAALEHALQPQAPVDPGGLQERIRNLEALVHTQLIAPQTVPVFSRLNMSPLGGAPKQQ